MILSQLLSASVFVENQEEYRAQLVSPEFGPTRPLEAMAEPSVLLHYEVGQLDFLAVP